MPRSVELAGLESVDLSALATNWEYELVGALMNGDAPEYLAQTCCAMPPWRMS